MADCRAPTAELPRKTRSLRLSRQAVRPMIANLEMWGRDIEACRQLLSSMLTLRIRHADELSQFPRSNLLLNMLDQVADAVQLTIEDAEERLIERLQAGGQQREGPPRSVGPVDPSRFDEPKGAGRLKSR